MLEAHDEAHTYRDIVFLNMTESFHLCAWKKVIATHLIAHLSGSDVVMGSLDTRSTFQILWYRWATATFPSARYLAIADDDAYVQIAHLEADLRLTSSIVHSPWVLHGLLMWKAFYIATSHEPATEFGGWRPTDFKAAALRDHIERCRLSRLLHNASAEAAAAQCERGAGCYTMRAWSRLLHNASAEAPANRSSSTSRSMPSSSASSHADGSPSAGVTSGVGMAGDSTGRRSHGRSLRTASRHSGGHSGHSGGHSRRSSPSRIAHDPCAKVPKKLLNRLDELHRAPPYPFANGPLIVLSRPLASLLAVDAYPAEWLASLERTPVLQFYRQRGRVPFVLRKDACFPASFDAVLGWWVYQVEL
jgi:hypothetical protein